MMHYASQLRLPDRASWPVPKNKNDLVEYENASGLCFAKPPRNLTFPEKKNQLSLVPRVSPNSFLTTSFDENRICRECNFPASLSLRLPSRHVQEHSASASTIRHPNAASHLLFWATTVGWKFESKERISIYKLKPQVNNITHHLPRYFDHPPIMPRPSWPSALFTSRIFSYLQPPGDLAQ